MTRNQIANACIYAALFFLPWQTVRIVHQFLLNGEPWEYGKFTIFAVELLVVAVAVLRKRHVPLLGSSRPIGFGLVLLAGAFISLSFSESQPLGFAMLFHVAAAFALFYFLLDEQLRTSRIALAFVLGLVLPAALGWYQVIMDVSPASTLLGLSTHDAAVLGQSVVETEGGRQLRAYGSLPHPNVFGGFLAVGTFVLAWLVYQHRAHKHHAWIALPIVFLASTLVITFSRGSWLGLSVGFLVLAGFMLFERKVLPRKAIPMMTAGIAAVLLTLVMFHTAVFVRFTPGARLEAQSIDTRAGEYGQVLEVVKPNPLTGVGIGQYTLALARRYPGGENYVYQPMHNAFLLIFAEIGLFGFALFAAWAGTVAQIIWKKRKTARGMFAIGLGSALITLAFLDHYPWSSWPGLALMAVSCALMLRWNLDEKVS